MSKFALILIFYFLIQIKGIEEILVYSILNDYITIKNTQKFFIETNVESIAYFDSIDKTSIFYISKDYQEDISLYDERITGKFYKIEPNVRYFVKNKVFFNQPSNLKRYLYPLDLSNQEIIIDDYSFNYLYLQKDKTYSLNFAKSSIKKIIALSRKTLNSKIIINKNNEKIELNKYNIYFKLDDEFKGKLILEIKGDNAFIEFLSGIYDNEDYKILEGTFLNNYELTTETSILIVPYTQKDLYIILTSDSPFKVSFSYGFSSEKLYYYNSKSEIESRENLNDIELILHGVFRDVILMNNEIFSFVIKIQKKTSLQKIYLIYNQKSLFDYIIDEEIEENHCKSIIKNINDLLDIYVFTDIAKNPPKINGEDYHEKIDLKKELDNINTSNRKFYEFYQDIMRLLGKLRDLHFSIYAYRTPKKNYMFQSLVLPFNFIIKEYKYEPRIFIEKNIYYEDIPLSEKKIYDKYTNIPLKTINDKDPFDYIQNWSKFNSAKNPHAQFTDIIKQISGFYLFDYPLNYSELSLNDYEFEDNQILRIPYLIKGLSLKNNIEFQNYFSNIIQSYEKNKKVPLIDTIHDNFLIFKGQKKKLKKELKTEIQSNIEWDQNLSYIEVKDSYSQFFKCRVDDENKVNVIYQNSFSFNSEFEAIGKMLKCVKEFYSNDYPIIIIESNNNGGYHKLAAIFLQILQPNIEFKDFYSYKITPISQEFFKNKKFNYYDCLNCKLIQSFDDFINNNYFYIDNYGDNTINHKRTFPIDLINDKYRVALNEFREELKNLPNFKKNFKKPTDIIIFTDSYTFSAASNFIKGFQNTGGAVTVGYFGNPKIKGTDLFDASQSPSIVKKDDLNSTKIYKELYDLGFIIDGITVGESYSFHQHNMKDQIPREYEFDPVDFRVDIYSEYSDSLYDKFIQEGLNIHKKLNLENFCNSKNKKLLLHDDNCKNIEGYEHAHGGGYKCSENNIWDKSKCEPYYCDIGYYFDQYQKECIQNCKYDKIKSYFIYEDKIDRIFKIEKDTINYFIFTQNIINNNKYFLKYDIFDSPVIIPVTNNIEVKIGYSNFDYDLQMKTGISNIKVVNLHSSSTKYSIIEPQETIIFFRNNKDFNLYLDNSFKSSETEFRFAKVTNEMTLDDILNINTKYFIIYSENIQTFKEYQQYLFYIKFNGLNPFDIYINPIN